MKIFSLIPLFLRFVSAFVFTPPQSQQILQGDVEITETDVKHLLAAHDDDPVHAAVLDEPRLLKVFETEPAWMTEGDKIRFEKQGLPFTDITGHENFSVSTVSANEDISVYLFL